MKGKKNPETFGRKWRYLFMILALVFSVGVSAQKTVVKGNILDKDNLPVIGANILEKGTTNGTISDVDGNFTITVSDPKAVLLIKYIGYKDVEKVVSPTMKIVMEEDSEMLEDVVVIGYGSVKKSDATGSVTAIKPDDFNKGLRTTAQDALVGKVPGVNVVSSSGAPGAGATIRIRSGASLSASNDPLIVVDGVPVDNSTIEGGGNVIGGINPNDIETFTVLKDASATAIYGSRASNGVIVITTKKGSDSNLRFNYSTNLSVSTITEKLDVLSADEFREFVPTVSGVPSSVTLGTASTDWQDEIYRTAFGQEHNFSVSGKVKKNAPYRLIPQVIIFVPRRKIQQQEGNPPLLLEIFHKRDLVLVDVCERKGIRFALFGIEADGNALYSADVINGTLLFKISQRDVSALLIYFDRGDRRRHLLDQCQMLVTVLLVCAVDHFLQR